MANPSVVIEYIAKTAELVSAQGDVEKSTRSIGDAIKSVDWKSVAGWAAAATAATATVAFIKKSTDATTDLAKQTVALQRATGLETETASAWVSMLKTRGIEVSTFSVALTKLSRTMEAARTGSESARKTLEDLGVSQQAIATGNVQQVLLEVADAYSQMENPAQKAATAQQLFGRSAQQLAPLLAQGAEGIQTQIDLAKKYGAVLGDEQIDQVKRASQAQRELSLAQQGVAVAVGSAVLPAQAALYEQLLRLVQVVLPFVDNVHVMEGVLLAAGAGMVALKVATLAQTAAELGLNGALVVSAARWVADTAAKVAAAVATWALNAGLLVTVALTGGVVLAIGALIVAGILLVKNWDKIAAAAGTVWGKIKQAASAALSWLKRNWPLVIAILVGPLAIAAVLVWKNWDKIRDGAVRAVGAIKGAWDSLVSFFSGLAHRLGAVFDRIADAMREPINAVIGALNALEIPGQRVTISVPGPLPDVHFATPTIDVFPDIPRLARGGIVTRPTLAMLGEGGPEAVVPLRGRGSGAVVVNVDTLNVREEADIRRIVAQLSAAVAVRL